YPDLTIYYGGELYYTSDIVEKLEKNLIPRMHNTQFALIEFSARTSWKEIHSGLSNVLRAGVTPIVAHIERYDALEENADRVREIINMGCYTQVNSSHVLKPKLFGDKDKVRKKRVRYFLEKNLVHMVASDMHNLGPRPPFMKDAYAIIEKTYGTRRARNLFIENPQTLLENQYI
ncbi:MAG: CpsB/CapC family capsule biosynthesis tyrosine phosphatase, partial [Streptococcus sp.]|nr:CpsB/CapC family capsule biosynthesis tyrosine phosphatase [Streptococcus sp.]